ncbi:MAG: hypothetical protein ACRDKB_11265 [Actinomycetota bacterium]
MRTRTLVAILSAALVAATFGAPSGYAADQGKKKKPGSVVVAEDPAGDWGANQDAALAPAGDAAGMDLIEASIGMADKKTVEFTIKVNNLPPAGGVPEFVRYLWEITVDGELVEFDGKFTNFSRGACDPTSGQCPPPRNPGLYPFIVRGNCTTTQNLTTCEELGIVEATFDAAQGTIAFSVPLKLINAKPGSKIAAGSTDFSTLCGGPIIAIPSAFLSFCPSFPVDAMQMTKTFKVPGKK